MFDHFGIHQNVPTQELFELFINYNKFCKQAICNRLICYRPLYLQSGTKVVDTLV